VAAAKALIDYALRVAAIQDLATRIDELERNMVANEPNSNEFENARKTIDAPTGHSWATSHSLPASRWDDQDDSEEELSESVQ
jgi:hypothetical protein